MRQPNNREIDVESAHCKVSVDRFSFRWQLQKSPVNLHEISLFDDIPYSCEF